MSASRKNVIFVEMKKYVLLVITLLLIGVGTNPANASEADNGRRIALLVNEYSYMDNFEVVSVGRLGLGLVKVAIRKSGDEDAMALLNAMKDIKRIIVTNYESCDKTIKDEFTSRLKTLLDKDQLLIEAKDSGDLVQIFGVPSDDGSKVTDLIINAPDEGALICVQGSIPMEKVVEKVNQ